MLQNLRKLYPDTAVICGTLMRTQIQGNPFWDFPESGMGYSMEEYNQVIRQAAKKNGCLLADLGALGLRYETMDGSHPNAKGHQTVTPGSPVCRHSAFLRLRINPNKRKRTHVQTCVLFVRTPTAS